MGIERRTMIEELERLGAMMEKGLLSAEEFTLAKAELLTPGRSRPAAKAELSPTVSEDNKRRREEEEESAPEEVVKKKKEKKVKKEKKMKKGSTEEEEEEEEIVPKKKKKEKKEIVQKKEKKKKKESTEEEEEEEEEEKEAMLEKKKKKQKSKEDDEAQQDEWLTCRDCNSKFEFTADDQKKYLNNPKPTRCAACKGSKKQKFSGKMPPKAKKWDAPKPCERYINGACEFGAECYFSHA